MKKLTEKIRYTINGHVATLYAKPSAGPLYSKRAPWMVFASCHVATLPLIRKDGIKACAKWLTLPQGPASKATQQP